MAVAITRQDESAADLRRLVRLCRNVAQTRRLLAIASVVDGRSRTEAAMAAGMDWKSLRDLVHWFIGETVRSRRQAQYRPSSPLSEEQLEDLDTFVEADPDLETDGVVRWRCGTGGWRREWACLPHWEAQPDPSLTRANGSPSTQSVQDPSIRGNLDPNLTQSSSHQVLHKTAAWRRRRRVVVQ